MSRRILKYKLVGRSVTANMPIYSKVIDFSLQKGELYVWVEVESNTNVSTERRYFRVYKTGDIIPSGASHITSLHMRSGKRDIVEHLYEIISSKKPTQVVSSNIKLNLN